MRPEFFIARVSVSKYKLLLFSLRKDRFHLLWADLITLWCTVKQIRFGLRHMHGRPMNQLHPRCSSSSRWPSPKSALGHCTATNAKPDSVTVARLRAFYSTNAHHSPSSRGSRDLEPVNQGVHCRAAASASPGSLPGMQSLGPHRRPARSEPAFWADPRDPCAPALTSAHLLDEKEKRAVCLEVKLKPAVGPQAIKPLWALLSPPQDRRVWAIILFITPSSYQTSWFHHNCVVGITALTSELQTCVDWNTPVAHPVPPLLPVGYVLVGVWGTQPSVKRPTFLEG